MVTLGLPEKSTANRRVRRSQPGIDVFFKMCEQVLDFTKEHGEQGVEVFFAREDGSLSLYLVTKAGAFDFELSRKLAEFAAPYITRGALDSATLLPAASADELEAFFDLKTALRVEIRHA